MFQFLTKIFFVEQTDVTVCRANHHIPMSNLHSIYRVREYENLHWILRLEVPRVELTLGRTDCHTICGVDPCQCSNRHEDTSLEKRFEILSERIGWIDVNIPCEISNREIIPISRCRKPTIRDLE